MTFLYGFSFCALAGYCAYRWHSKSLRDEIPLCERRKQEWGGMPKAYVITAPRETRKQWRQLQITKR